MAAALSSVSADECVYERSLLYIRSRAAVSFFSMACFQASRVDASGPVPGESAANMVAARRRDSSVAFIEFRTRLHPMQRQRVSRATDPFGPTAQLPLRALYAAVSNV